MATSSGFPSMTTNNDRYDLFIDVFVLPQEFKSINNSYNRIREIKQICFPLIFDRAKVKHQSPLVHRTKLVFHPVVELALSFP